MAHVVFSPLAGSCLGYVEEAPEHSGAFSFLAPYCVVGLAGMPVDFQVVFPQELVALAKVENLPGVSPRTLRLVGEDFRSAEEVRINEMVAPAFTVRSRTELWVEVPAPLRDAVVSTVAVVSQRLTITSKSFMRFRIGRTPGKVRGILRLSQLFLKVLFTTPGTDIFSPGSGGGALRHIGQSVDVGQGSDLAAHLVVCVDNTVRQILQVQSRNQALPADERLLSATVTSAGFNKNETALVATIELASMAGETVTTRLEV